MILNKNFKRYFACFMAANILFQVVTPTAALALTGGPSQPEMESFEPISTNQMVDAFTGDFTYNVPLLTVPGPNGGYPINMAYHAGIGMEQEASWVGLGWNISPGVINRQLRGIPDDFNGSESIKKTLSYKPQWTVGLGFDCKSGTYLDEMFGVELEKAFTASQSIPKHFQLYYNSYKGVGFAFGSNIGKEGGKGRFNLKAPLTYSIDSQNGFGVQANLKMDFAVAGKENSQYFGSNLNAGFNSRQGFTGLGYSASYYRRANDAASNPTKTRFSCSSGTQFSSSSYMPPLSTSLTGINAKFSIESQVVSPVMAPVIIPGQTPPVGLFGDFNAQTYSIDYSQQFINFNTIEYPAYGYLNLGGAEADDKEHHIMDYNREKDYPLTKDVPSLPLPVNTYDVFLVKGQGTGGSFRPYRKDIGIFSEPALNNYFVSGSGGIEFAEEVTNNHLGGDVVLGYSQSYSGPWKSQADQLGYFHFKSENPVYFKMAGELTASDDLNGDMGRLRNEDIVKLDLNMQYENLSFVPKVLNNSDVLSHNLRNSNERMASGIQYKTRNEIALNSRYTPVASSCTSRVEKNIGYRNIWNGTCTTAVWSDPNNSANYCYWDQYDYSATDGKNGNHIAEVSVVNPDGNRYVYGIPAYNTKQEDYHFACDNSAGSGLTSTYKYLKLTDYEGASETGADVDISNDDGYDHFYSKNEIPPYAHSYLLSSIISPDYVDLTRNGPTDDDLGYFVKFNYVNDGSFKWRAPYNGAFLHKNGLSDFSDDKASFTYGEKEMWYQHSIETKTHVAVFELGDREDGIEADDVDVHSNSYPSTVYRGSKKTKYLKTIKLYAKSDLTTPIKTVNFDYDYSLCGNVDNNSGTAVTVGSTNINANKGKLTLKKVWFTYLDNTKGELSPYEFDYHATTSSENPDYSISQMDRWGNYKPDGGTSGSGANDENPYVDQNSVTNANTYMGVWNLKSIKLPSGAKIDVTYEADDYAYVQDKVATQMVEITGTGNGNETDGISSVFSGDCDITHHKLRLYFDAQSPYNTSSTVGNYFSDLQSLYFKAYVDLKDKPDHSARAREYVSGYGQVAGYGVQTITGVGNKAYVDLKEVQVTKIGMQSNPIRKAGWDYLRTDKPNYLPGSNSVSNSGASIGWQTFNSVIGIMTNALSMLTGYYRQCQILQYSKYLRLDDDYPSYVRLNAPGKHKLGGGHRVSKITILDSWHEITGNAEDDFSYGQTYTYAMPDGSSSGVAEYEPMVGAEENALRNPSDVYQDNPFGLANHNLFIEKPFGESFYPGASVGYRRVTVTSMQRTTSNGLPSGEAQTLTRAGYSVTEFYTAKDFPVAVDLTPVTTKGYTPDIAIPFVGALSFHNKGYSQGYRIMLNDMHGKVKSTSTYAAFSDPADASSIPVTKTDYIYNTIKPYNPNAGNAISPFVTVLDGDANYRVAAVGQTYDFFSELTEHSSWSSDAGGGLNFEYEPAFLFVPSFWIKFDFSQAVTRMAVSNKVIYRTGILTEVRTTKDGGTSVAKNLMFDKKTGQPLLTSVTNDFDAPVYSYSYPAHWNYPNMGDVSERYGKILEGSFAAPLSGVITLLTGQTSDGFNLGDMVEAYNPSTSSYQDFWVSAKTSGSITLIDEFGDPITSTVNTIKNVQPAAKNLLGVSSGNIVALANPVVSRGTNQAIDLLNLILHESPTGTASIHKDFIACEDNQPRTLVASSDFATDIVLTKITGEDKCEPYISFTSFPSAITSWSGLVGYKVSLSGTTVHFDDDPDVAGTVTSFTGTWSDTDNSCWKTCVPDILHASASTFNDEWEYNYEDAGSPITMNSTGTTTLAASVAVNNPYRYGTKGIWRTQNSYAYQTDRKQSTPTDISKDGTYEGFQFFNWLTSDPTTDNPTWTFVNEVTRYSPYGYELENRDALNLYKCALYGYNNSVVTAVAANSSYHETAFDGFEEYGGTYGTSGTSGKGHLQFSASSGGVNLSNTHSHTGNYACSLTVSHPITHTINYLIDNTNIASKSHQNFAVKNVTGEKYTVSAWFYGSDDPSVSVSFNGTAPGSGTTSTYISPVIDGWKKIDYTFTLPSSIPTSNITVSFDIGSTAGYVDDIRMQPFKSGMTSYVYDPKTLWLVAELDNRNFATFYNYDEEGTLVQVKKETENGVSTVKTTRANIKR